MRAVHWLSALGPRFRSSNGARLHRRRTSRLTPIAIDASRLEERCLLSEVVAIPMASRGSTDHAVQVVAKAKKSKAARLLSDGVPIPTTNPQVPLNTIFWNGEAQPLNPSGKPNIPAPSSVGATKTITISNDSTDMIYPFLRGQNSGTDPHNIGPDGKPTPAPYDPQDLMGHEFREYIGYTASDGTNYLGLPSGALITVQVPLALWDGDNLYIATSGDHLTSANIFKYNSSASISIAGPDQVVSGTTWVQKSNKYPAGTTPLVMFYYTDTPETLPDDAPAQLTEVTFRDQYLTNFINGDPTQTFPLLNYDVSYVNNLVAPVSMEASNVPITYQTNPTGPPTYYGYEDFGWLATDRKTGPFEAAIADFENPNNNALLGKYFGGKGWPEYYNPDANHHQIPSGANLFLDSPLSADNTLVHTSTYDANHWLLTSSGSAPIQAGGAGVGQQGFVYDDSTNQIDLNNPSSQFVTDLQAMLAEGVVNVTYPGSSQVLATVASYNPNPGGMPYVTLNGTIPPSGPSGAVYAFTRTASDYAVTDITNLWYSWAQHYVNLYQNFAPETYQGTLAFTGQYATNQITLPSKEPSLAVGMSVTAPSGIAPGTTILKIVKNTIYLSQIPADDTPATQDYTFSKPQPIPYAQSTKPFKLTFAKDDTNSQLFAGSVYEAMSAEAAVNPLPPSYLPDSMNLVSQVIQFYAKLPGYDRTGNPTAPVLIGEVRDVVKSILRGVYDYNAITDQLKWYPDPSTPTGGQGFNVYNLDPYVWFVHKVEQMSAYGFSVDDDVSNPTATGPLLAADGQANHYPNNLQIDFGGTESLGKTTQWFPTIPWGSLTAHAIISKLPADSKYYPGSSIITFVKTKPSDPDPLKIYNEINNPGTGQQGATITAPGYIQPGTTLIFKGPNGGTNPQIVLSQPATPTTSTPILVTITAQP